MKSWDLLDFQLVRLCALLLDEFERQNAIFQKGVDIFQIQILGQFERPFELDFGCGFFANGSNRKRIALHIDVDIALFYAGKFYFQSVDSALFRNGSVRRASIAGLDVFIERIEPVVQSKDICRKHLGQ